MRREANARHDTARARKVAGVDSSVYWEYDVGQRVTTVDGFPGQVVAVHDGPHPGNETYEVELDNGMGGGDYHASELHPLNETVQPEQTTAAKEAEAEHLASDDYPELADILVQRPPLENAQASAKEAYPVRPSQYGDPTPGYVGPWYVVEKGKPSNVIAGPFDTWGSAQGWRAGNDWRFPERGEVIHEKSIPAYEGPVYEQERGAFHPDRPEWSRAASKEDAQQSRRPFDELPVIQSEAGPVLDWVNEKLPERARNRPGNQWSYDWCRFRRDSKCYYPRFLDKEASEQAGYPVWIPYDRGWCPRTTWEAQEECPVGEPGPNTGRPDARPDATVSWEEGGQRFRHTSGVTTPPFEFTASWRDVQRKAKRIKDTGGVRIISAPEKGTGNLRDIVANVNGDTSVYQTRLTRVPNGNSIAMWECGCAWASYSWGRSGRWKKYEGRMCSHALAVLYEAQSREGFWGEETIPEDTQEPSWMRDTEVVYEHDKPPLPDDMGFVSSKDNLRPVETDPFLQAAPAVRIGAGLLRESKDPAQVRAYFASLGVDPDDYLAKAGMSMPRFPVKYRGGIHEVAEISGGKVVFTDGTIVENEDLEHPKFHPNLGLTAAKESFNLDFGNPGAMPRATLCSEHAKPYTKLAQPTPEDPCEVCGATSWKDGKDWDGKEAAQGGFIESIDDMRPGQKVADTEYDYWFVVEDVDAWSVTIRWGGEADREEVIPASFIPHRHWYPNDEPYWHYPAEAKVEANYDGGYGTLYDEGYADQATDGHPDPWESLADDPEGQREYAQGVANANEGVLPDSPRWSRWGLPEDGVEAAEDLDITTGLVPNAEASKTAATRTLYRGIGTGLSESASGFQATADKARWLAEWSRTRISDINGKPGIGPHWTTSLETAKDFAVGGAGEWAEWAEAFGEDVVIIEMVYEARVPDSSVMDTQDIEEWNAQGLGSAIELDVLTHEQEVPVKLGAPVEVVRIHWRLRGDDQWQSGSVSMTMNASKTAYSIDIDLSPRVGDVEVSAVEDGRTVGYMLADVDPRSVFISEVNVDADYQRQGVATAMLRALVEMFPDRYYHAGAPERNTEGGNAWAESLGLPGYLGAKTAQADVSDGAMVALRPPDHILDELVERGVVTESYDNLHITVGYLGKAADIDADAVHRAVQAFAQEASHLRGRVGGYGTFNNSENVLWASYDIPGLDEWRAKLLDFLAGAGVVVAKDHSYTPHMTLAYSDDEPFTEVPDTVPEDDFILDDVIVAVAGDWTHYPLEGGAPRVQSEASVTDLDFDLIEGGGSDIGYDGADLVVAVSSHEGVPVEVGYAALGPAGVQAVYTEDGWEDIKLLLRERASSFTTAQSRDTVDTSTDLTCPVCGGDGRLDDGTRCWNCGGDGKVEAKLDEQPEPALPQTDGDPEGEDVVDEDAMQTGRAHASRSWLMNDSNTSSNGGGRDMDMSDIAAQAKQYLDDPQSVKTAGKRFSPAEQRELIDEGPAEGQRARNFDRLDITGTHYEQLEQMEDDDDDLSLLWLM